MKKFLIAMLMLPGLLIQAQPPDRPDGPPNERIEAMRIAFITDRLNLTPEESQQFWPVFNEFRDAEKALREEMKPPRALEDLTDSEARDLLDRQLQMIDREAALRKSYMQQLREVLPDRKLLRLKHVEGEFRRQLLQEVRERRNNRRRAPRGN